jgi:hypothetical protein
MACSADWRRCALRFLKASSNGVELREILRKIDQLRVRSFDRLRDANDLV